MASTTSQTDRIAVPTTVPNGSEAVTTTDGSGRVIPVTSDGTQVTVTT